MKRLNGKVDVTIRVAGYSTSLSLPLVFEVDGRISRRPKVTVDEQSAVSIYHRLHETFDETEDALKLMMFEGRIQ